MVCWFLCQVELVRSSTVIRVAPHLMSFLAKKGDIEHVAVGRGPASEEIGLERCNIGRFGEYGGINVWDMEEVRVRDHPIGHPFAECLDLLANIEQEG